ncbi:MAG: ROK family protein [Verrucomicrobiota bacterium]
MAPSASSDTPPLLAGIEAGGTKYVCAIALNPEEPLLEERFPTRHPQETMNDVVQFFSEAKAKYGPLRSMGIGTFGPANIHPRSPGYGEILTTPKDGWEGFNVVQCLKESLEDPVPIAFETDVNAAAIGEAVYGAGRSHRHICYVTVGTGIGAGFLHDGIPLHGRMHPEVGHMIMPDLDAAFGKSTNVCPFHPSCWEGRASGPAIEARWGAPGNTLPDDHPAWELEAQYLAHGAVKPNRSHQHHEGDDQNH